MGKSNKKNKYPQDSNNQNGDTYNKSKNFNKIRKFSNDSHPVDISPSYNESNAGLSSVQSKGEYTSSTLDGGNYNTLSERVDDKIGSLSDKNESQHDILRKDLESKIEEKINKLVSKNEFRSLFYGAIGIIGIIGTLIYNLSYKDILENSRVQKNETIQTDSIKRSINMLRNKVITLEK